MATSATGDAGVAPSTHVLDSAQTLTGGKFRIESSTSAPLASSASALPAKAARLLGVASTASP
jgi:hypothetical protein